MGHLENGSKVAVIGAGLAGSCTALALAQSGVNVVLLEQDQIPMNRASLRNEGKIHLGFVYANDPTLATARLMLEGALSFGPILRNLVGNRFAKIGISMPFVYLVAHDSLLDVEQLHAFYGELDGVYSDLKGRGLDYLGTMPDALYRPLEPDDWTRWFSPQVVSAAFYTEELAIDSGDLAEVVRDALVDQDRVRLTTGHRVEEVETRSGGFRLSGRQQEGRFSIDVSQVVNATWERRSALDACVGLMPEKSILHRLKYRVIGRLPEPIRGGPSATMVLGRYGDVVVRPNGTAFLSWYPVGLRGWDNGAEPPRAWDDPCRGDVDAEIRKEIADGTIEAIQRWYPGIADTRPELVDAGAIVAVGATDVDDPDSLLHSRTRVGVRSLDGYHSLDPGKLTTAPMYAMEAASCILEGGDSGHRPPWPEQLVDRFIP